MALRKSHILLGVFSLLMLKNGKAMPPQRADRKKQPVRLFP